MNNHRILQYLHLGIAAGIILVVGLIYGFDPANILPRVFGFTVESLELKNIFRAMMGLYLTLAAFWIVGIIYPKHWQAATLTCVLFMGGLAGGRIISTLIDGFSRQYTIGLFLELGLMLWGVYNLRRYQMTDK